jgi:hypothetical protein
MQPEFPNFKPIQLEDREMIRETLWKYQPQTSEWTFTNLFIWRSHYGFQWSMYKDWLIVLCTSSPNETYAFQPIGPPSRLEVTRRLLEWLREEKGEKKPCIKRADQRLIKEIEGSRDLQVEPTREQFDYIYRSDALIRLAGRKYHSKRNHINKFLHSYSFTYAALNKDHLEASLELSGLWCEVRRCEEDLNLLGEWEAVREALTHFHALSIQGGVILMQNKVEAFALGELLNDQTAVVHVEKANPEIPGLYTMINQQFCEKSWQNVPSINREQDLGEPGLRQAKLSYYPDHLVEKFRIQLADSPENPAIFRSFQDAVQSKL